MGKDKKGRNLGKGIRQRPDGRYEARFVDAKGNRRSVYADTLKSVKKILAECMAADESGMLLEHEYRLDEWYKIWVQTYKEGHVRESTMRIYSNTYKLSIGPYLGSMRLSDIRRVNVQETINRALSDGYGYSRQDKIKRILHDMCQRAIEDEVLLRNPVSGCKLTAEKPTERRVLTREEQEIFLEYSKGEWYEDFFIFALNTGLRPGEIYALKPDSFDFQRNVVMVTSTLHYRQHKDSEQKIFYEGPPKTKHSVRSVPLNSAAQMAIDRQMLRKADISRKHPGDVPYIFVTSRNHPMNSQLGSQAVSYITGKINADLPMDEWITGISPHTFRHTFATRCLEAGIPAKVVQAYLGHATLQMTMDLYTHVTDDYGMDSIELLC